MLHTTWLTILTASLTLAAACVDDAEPGTCSVAITSISRSTWDGIELCSAELQVTALSCEPGSTVELSPTLTMDGVPGVYFPHEIDAICGETLTIQLSIGSGAACESPDVVGVVTGDGFSCDTLTP